MSVLIIGQFVYGHGETLAEAKKNFTKFGGRLSLGYSIVEFGENQQFEGVDGFGRYHWKGEAEPPPVREVTARKTR